MKTRIQVIFYSMYGHVWQMAEAVAKGAREVPDTEVSLFRVAELVPDLVLEKSGAKAIQQKFSHIPLAAPAGMAEADAILFGTPTRYGNMCAQMRNFLDQTGGLWAADKLVGKIGSAFVSTGTQHGGQETTLTSFHTTLLHLGMIVVGMPYSQKGQMNMEEITGGSPYGATTLAGDGSRQPSQNELTMASWQGQYVATIATALKRGREG